MTEPVCCVCGEFSCTRHSESEHRQLVDAVRETRAQEQRELYEHAKWHWSRLGYWDSQPWGETAQDAWDYESYAGAWSAVD
jgi:hypothetical protein